MTYGYTDDRDPRGRPATCHCGDCRKCKRRVKQREYMRLYNQGLRRPLTPIHWTPEMDALLATDTDDNVATALNITKGQVQRRRYRIRVPAYKPPPGRCTTDRGYITVTLQRDDPLIGMTRSNRSVQEHRLVMARHLGRPLTRDEIVHHRNGIKSDNRLENLELWTRSHPDGQRVEDVFEWCIEFIERYSRELETPEAEGVFSVEIAR